VNFLRRSPFLALALVLAWRVLLLFFTAQPIPANDAFGYDGAVVNYLHGGAYCNPSFSVIFPISGREIYATYPPLYQAAVFVWMKIFGTSVISAMWLHLALFLISGLITVAIVKRFFPSAVGTALAVLLLFGLTFDDRPEGLAYVFGLSALSLVTQLISKPGVKWGISVLLAVSLLLTLYTSVIVGAYFFGVGFLTCIAALIWRWNFYWFVPFLAAAVFFFVITFAIARWEPLWWAGFMESARQQSVMTNGLHLPAAGDLLKLVRTAPVFIVALFVAPSVFMCRREVFSKDQPWLALLAGIAVMGWVLLIASVTFLAANYVNYTIFTQVILAAGLLALAAEQFSARTCLLRTVLVACVCLVSIRAVGMTTWGVACASKNSYKSAEAVIKVELEPYSNSIQPVLISSAFLYQAADIGVKNPVHSDWYFDHSHWTNSVQINALMQLQPTKLVLTQFDYYRSFAVLMRQLESQPDIVEVRIRNLAAIKPPDAIPSMQRVVQNISWAPVIVDLNWKKPSL